MRHASLVGRLSQGSAFFALALSMVFVGSPARAVVPNTNSSLDTVHSLWSQHQASVSSWSGSAAPTYATDHILVKRSGEAVQSVPVTNGQSVTDAVTQWSQTAGVDYAEPDGLVRALGQETTWGWSDVKADTAASTNGATGSGVIVAVVDTGVDYNHEDLSSNMWVNTGETANDGIDNDGNGYVDDVHGYDFIGSMYTAIAPDNDPQDEYGHGSHVAGIIAAQNNTLGVEGVAPSAQIMAVKVLDSNGTGFDSDIVSGIEYAVDNGADIINLSLGSQVASNAFKAGIDYAAAHNVLVVAAAGNEYTYSAPSYPANYDSVISVGAINEDGFKADFSNWGKVDVVAPGVDINSTIPGNLYAKYSGTSMASPFVAGVAALVMQKQGTIGNPKATRQVLETTATDFGIYSGQDYVSGYGKINALAATGTLAASAYLHADTGFVATDGSDNASVTVSVRNAANVAVAATTVTWTTDKGTLSAASSTTNASGEATITFTDNGDTGLATITATTSSTNPVHIQVALLSDVVEPLQIGLTPYDDTSSSDVIIFGGDNGSDNIPTDTITDTTTGLSYNEYQAGDMITLWADATGFDRDTHTVTMTYSVTDPDDNAVTDLSGTSPEADVGVNYYGIYYFPQGTLTSQPLTIPTDAANGKYTETITITDVDSGETATRSTNFWVGELPGVLLVDNNGYCFDTPVEAMDFGFIPYCSGAVHIVADSLTSLGYDSLVWDTTQTGYPTADDLKQFPMVVWLDATFSTGDNTVFQDYLDAGGNLLLSSENNASYNNYNTAYGQPATFLWNYLHARYASSIAQPDLVTGIAGTDFAGLAYNIDTYDINSDASHTMYMADELELNDSDGAEAIFAYDQGATTTHAAGVRVDTGSYRVAYLSFGLAAVNDDVAGYTSRATLTDSLMTWLKGTNPHIASVSDSKPENNADRTITIHGKGFQPTGITTVKLRNRLLNDVVVSDRHTITATIPADLDTKHYSLTVTNPDGREATKSKAIHVKIGGPYLDTSSQTILSNNKEHVVTLTGNHFTSATQVHFNKYSMAVKYDSSTSLHVTVPAGFQIGTYAIKLYDAKSALHSSFAKAIAVRVGFTEDLATGANSSQVHALEQRLKTYGYFSGQPNKSFTASTGIALAQYQQSLGIPQTSQLDELTRYYLNTND